MRTRRLGAPAMLRYGLLVLLLIAGLVPQGAGSAWAEPIATPTVACDLVPIDTYAMLNVAADDTPTPFSGGTVRVWDDGPSVWVDGTTWVDLGGYLKFVPPPGQPASTTIQAGIANTLAEWQACWTDGHGEQLFRMLSDQGLQWVKTAPDALLFTEPTIAYLRQLTPSFASWPTVLSYTVEMVRSLSDGRAIAVIAPVADDPGTWRRLLWVFSPHDGDWRVDRVMGPFVELPFPKGESATVSYGSPQIEATPTACPLSPSVTDIATSANPDAPAVFDAGVVSESLKHPPLVRVNGTIWVLDGDIEAGVPPGQHAPPDVRAGVAATLETWATCWNAGQGERLFTLLSHDGQEWIGYAPPWLLADDPTISYLTRLDPTLPPPSGTPVAYGIRLTRILSDGRALVLADPRPDIAGSPVRLMWILSPGDDGWRVDRVIGALYELPGSIVDDAPLTADRDDATPSATARLIEPS